MKKHIKYSIQVRLDPYSMIFRYKDPMRRSFVILIYLVASLLTLASCGVDKVINGSKEPSVEAQYNKNEYDKAKITGLPHTQDAQFNFQLDLQSQFFANKTFIVLMMAHCDMHPIHQRDHDILLYSIILEPGVPAQIRFTGTELHKKIDATGWWNYFTHFMVKTVLIAVDSSDIATLENPKNYLSNQVVFGTTYYLDALEFSSKSFLSNLYGIDPVSGFATPAPPNPGVSLSIQGFRILTTRENN